MSSKQHSDGTGKVELAVKMDYSDTYRENDRLDLDLDDHIIHLTRHAQRVLTETDEELIAARAEAEKGLRLKKAVKGRGGLERRPNSSLSILCQSPPKLHRGVSDMSSLSSASSSATGKRTTSFQNGSMRRLSEGNASSRDGDAGTVNSRSNGTEHSDRRRAGSARVSSRSGDKSSRSRSNGGSGNVSSRTDCDGDTSRRSGVKTGSSRSNDDSGNFISRTDCDGDTSTRSVGNSYGRRLSVISNLRTRRASMMSTDSTDGERGDDENSSTQGYTVLQNGDVADTRKKSLTERRLAMTREQFSSKNLFNVNRRHSSAISNSSSSDTKRDNSPDGLRKNLSAMTLNKQQGRQGRPMTSPGSFGGQRRKGRKSGYLRPTTASVSRLVRFSDDVGDLDDDDDFYYAVPRRARSRRELQKLSELRLDPFEDEEVEAEVEKAEGWSQYNAHQDLLQRLHGGQPQLQARVSAFLKDMEEFNKRGRSKSGLDQILEAT